MKKFLLPTLLAAVAMSFCAAPAFAEEVTLNDGGTNLVSDSGSTNWSGYTFTISSSLLDPSTWGTTGHKGAWIGWSTAGVENSSVQATITGTGFLGIAFKQGNGSHPTTIDLTNIDVSGFTGQLCVVNVWNENTTVKLSGDQWQNVEYIFGGVTRELSDEPNLGAGTWNESDVIFTRGIEADSNNDKDRDILALQDDTTLAGVTGTSKDFYVESVNLAADEYITVNSEGTKLTIAGSGTYGFYGTVGASFDYSSGSVTVTRASLAMTGSGKQTFGGTNYLKDVTVTAGTLALSGTTSITGSVSVATDSTLELGGEITLSSAISNSGTVIVDSDVVFVLDNLTADGSNTYTIISSTGNITGWDSSNLDYTSFTFSDGETLTSSRQIDLTTEGQVTIDTSKSAESLTWAGTSNTWTRDTSTTNWTNGSSGNDYFANGDSVTFGADAAEKTVNITGSLLAGKIAVNDDYTFVFADGIKVEASYVDVASSKTLTLQLATGASSAEFHMDSEDFIQFLTGSGENHGNLVIGAGVTFYLSGVSDSYSFYDGNTGVSITGTGTLSVAANNIGLYLPNFEGTVEFRSGTVRFGYQNSHDTGIYNANATLQFDDGVGITLVGDTSSAVSAKLVFEGTHTIATDGHTAEFSGAVDGVDATITISGAGKLTFSGGGSIGALTITAGSTLTFSGSTTYTITTITKSNSNSEGALQIASGTTVNAGTLNASWHVGTIQVDGVLNVSESIVLGSGYQETFTGTGTVTVGTLQVGHSSGSNPGSIKVDGGLTLIADEVTKGLSTNSYIDFGNATIGTSNGEGLTFSDATSFTLSAGTGESTTFNTNVYNTTTGAFTTTGTTITISVNVVGEGNIAVTGNGTLALTGSSSALGSVTVDSGATLSISNTVSLASGSTSTISGTVTLGESGTLSVGSGATITLNATLGTSNTGDVVFASGAQLIITDALLESAAITKLDGEGQSIDIIMANSITFGDERTQLSDNNLNDFVNDYIEYTGSYDLTWSYADGTLSAIVVFPEPSMFGLFFGLGAIGLVATRRRRRRKVA